MPLRQCLQNVFGLAPAAPQGRKQGEVKDTVGNRMQRHIKTYEKLFTVNK